MRAMHDHRTQLFRKKTEVGLMIGLAVGSLVGLATGGSVFTIFGSSLAFAIGVLAAFAIIFAVYGAFMGMLFDLDARERRAGLTGVVPSRPVRRVGRKRIKTQPVAASSGR